MGSIRWTVLALLALNIGACSGADPLRSEIGQPALKTDARTYVLEKSEFGLETTISFTYTNRTGGAVYLPGCHPPEVPILQKWEDGDWVDAWRPARTLCLSPPVEVAPGGTIDQTFSIFAGYPDSRIYAIFQVDEIPGEYRLVWSILRNWDPEQYAGESLSIEDRVSNSFRMEVQ